MLIPFALFCLISEAFPPLSLYLRWLYSSEAFEARQKQPSHRQDKLRAVCNQIWSCGVVGDALLYTAAWAMPLFLPLCLCWYCLMTLSEHLDAQLDTAKIVCEDHFEFWTWHWFIFWIIFQTGWHSEPSWCAHLFSIINHSRVLPVKIAQSQNVLTLKPSPAGWWINNNVHMKVCSKWGGKWWESRSCCYHFGLVRSVWSVWIRYHLGNIYRESFC